MDAARRIYLHALAFAGLMVVLVASANLVEQALDLTFLGSSAVLASAASRSSASFSLAGLIVGLPVWLAHWVAASRLAGRSPEERDAPVRRLYLAAIFATAAIVALFALRSLLQMLLTLPGVYGGEAKAALAFRSFARLAVFGAAGAASIRPGVRAGLRPRDQAFDVALYVVAGVALGFLATGAFRAVTEAARELLSLGGAAGATVLGGAASAWLVWGGIAAWAVAGGSAWGAAWSYDLARNRRDLAEEPSAGSRPLRVLYLYLVIFVWAAPSTLGAGAVLVYELLRRAMGYAPTGGLWAFAPGVLPWVLVGAVAWGHHWGVVRRQRPPSAPASEASSPPARGIPWPRRPAVALFMVGGLAAAVPGLVSLLWLALDLWLNQAQPLSGPEWWRDRLSGGIAAALVGGVLWIGAWAVMQRAAAADPARERAAIERRVALGAIVIVAALSALGLVTALLWLGFRALLGDQIGPDAPSRALKDLSGAAVALAVGAYYAVIMRADAAAQPPTHHRLRVLAVAAPEAEGLLARLRAQDGLEVRVLGRLEDGQAAQYTDAGSLDGALATLRADGDGRAALLVMSAGRATIFPIRVA